jgi:hypothetical protein
LSKGKPEAKKNILTREVYLSNIAVGGNVHQQLLDVIDLLLILAQLYGHSLTMQLKK